FRMRAPYRKARIPPPQAVPVQQNPACRWLRIVSSLDCRRRLQVVKSHYVGCSRTSSALLCEPTPPLNPLCPDTTCDFGSRNSKRSSTVSLANPYPTTSTIRQRNPLIANVPLCHAGPTRPSTLDESRFGVTS